MPENIQEILFSFQDELLQGLTYEELLLTLNCNEAYIDEPRLYKVFNELITARVAEARIQLRKNLPKLINQAIKTRNSSK